jgi:hypothetical protein
MSDELDPSPETSQGLSRIAMVIGVVVIAAAAAVGVWLMAGSKPAEVPSATKAAPAPETKAVPAAPAPDTPSITIEASRDKPRARKKTETPAPAPAPEPAAPTTGALRIDADVPGAMVFIDRKFVGNTPVTASDITPGRHQLNLTAEGFDGYSEAIEVAAGPADVLVKFKEVRLDESVDVVHKHAMGSCEGRLVADPQGIRYETSNKDDAFTLRFADVESFEIDYLKKNLRIKKRGGKQYNFTTKAASADPLFVFHRNVDKVRKQVAAR